MCNLLLEIVRGAEAKRQPNTSSNGSNNGSQVGDSEFKLGDAASAIKVALMHHNRTIQRQGCELASVFSAHSIGVAAMLLDAGNLRPSLAQV